MSTLCREFVNDPQQDLLKREDVYRRHFCKTEQWRSTVSFACFLFWFGLVYVGLGWFGLVGWFAGWLVSVLHVVGMFLESCLL